MAQGIMSCVLATLLVVSSFHGGFAASASLQTSSSARSNSKEGKASASGSITITSGEGLLDIVADAEARATTISEVAEYISTVENFIPKPEDPNNVDPEKYCPEVEAFLEAQAEVIGQAAASAEVFTGTNILINGEGSACGGAEAETQAKSVAFVDVLVEALAVAGFEEGNVALADGKIRAQTGAFAEAFAKASAEACLDGEGSAIAEQHVLAEALAKPVASVIIWLEAFVDCEFSDSNVEGEASATVEDGTSVSGDAVNEVDGAGTTISNGEGTAFAGQTQTCSGTHGICCTSRRNKDMANGGTCYCNLSGRKSRLMEPDCEVEKIVDDTTGTVFFKDIHSDFACHCA